MNLRQLHHFLTTVNQGSLARASRKLNLSLPALSKSIQNLEAALGVTLLVRGPKGMSPTEFGNALVVHAKLVNAQLDHARREISELKLMKPGRVSFGVGPSMAIVMVPTVLARMARRFPGVRIDLYEGYAEPLCRALMDGTADFIIAPDLGGLPSREIDATMLYTDSIVAMCRVAHPFAKRRAITVHDLATADWALPPWPDLARQHLETLFFTEGLPPPVPFVETNSQNVMKRLVRDSDALTLLPTTLMQAERQLIPLWNCPVRMPRNIFLIRRSLYKPSPAATALMEEFVAAGAALNCTIPKSERGAPRRAPRGAARSARL